MPDPVPTVTSAAPAIDLFLSYNRLDRAAVDDVCDRLQKHGLRTFLDHASLRPGLPWPQALQQALTSARGVAVFIGPHGLGGWQRREMFFALDLQVAAEKEARAFPVIPMLLDGADLTPSFLMLNSWVDLRHDNVDEAINALIAALGGVPSLKRSAADPLQLKPYVGLRSFREEDSAFFFGRNAFVERLFDCVARNNVTAAVGPSGSGKSSVVFAGLVPRLRKQRPPSRSWEVASFTPGRYPWRRLADALVPLLEPDVSEIERGTRAGELERDLTGRPSAVASAVERALRATGGADRLLLIVDQFEEVFTLATAEDGSSFIDTLFKVTDVTPLSIVLTLRADFYGRALESSRLVSDVLGRAIVPIGPLLPDEMRDAIERPVLKVGATFEPGLVDVILDDVLSQPGQLPLLEYALTELWTRSVARVAPAEDVVITLDAYRQSGKLAGAIAQRAEELYQSLSDAEQKATRRLFGLLVYVARGGEEGADARRRARRSETGEDCWTVAQKFAGKDYRLLVIADDARLADPTVEVAHEAIILHWARLKQWVDEDRVALAVEQQVAEARSLWEARTRDEAYLLEGPVLIAARNWAEQNLLSLNQQTLEFLIRSLVHEGLPLESWIPRYAEHCDAVALGRDYLSSQNSASRRCGLDVLRWIPSTSLSATDAAIEVAMSDPIAELRRYAVETVCGRRAEVILQDRLKQEPAGKRRQMLLRAIGHARNVRGIGKKALAGLPSRMRRRVSLYALLDLLSLNRGAFALSFALSSIFFTLGWDITSRALSLARDILAPHVGNYNLTGAYYELSFDLTVTMGLFVLLRAIIDEKPITTGYVFRIGLLAGCISELINIVGRLMEETVKVVISFFDAQGIHALNFVFAVTDELPTILATGILALALIPGATAQPGKTFLRRFAMVAAMAAAIAVVIGRFLVPAALDLIGLNFREPELGKLGMEAVNAFILSAVAGLAGLIGFRVSLRIAFDDRPFPEWPVPSPTGDA
ncbi:MAG: toll/interleukin-1 receptor domain-containing protein [Bryobacteraceae bacterium]